jgi:membrane dipeptidase
MNERADALHRRAIVVNGLGGGKVAVPRGPDDEFRLPELMAAGGVDAVNLTISFRGGLEETLLGLDRLVSAVGDAAGRIRFAQTAADIRQAHEDAVPAIVPGLQNSDALEGKLEYLRVLHRLGIRIVQLTYQRRNLVADGCGEPGDGGLSVFGRQVVDEMNRLGMLVDLSHTGVRSTLEAIEASRAPCAVTHACAYARNPRPRNKTDEEIRALAARGGVFGVNAVARLLSPEGGVRGATIDDFVDHVDHVAALVGVDHVGVGLDISEGMTQQDFEARRRGFLAEFPELGGEFPFEHYYVTGLDSMARLPVVTDALVRRGYDDESVLKILGGNFLRLFEAAWRPC